MSGWRGGVKNVPKLIMSFFMFTAGLRNFLTHNLGLFYYKF